ncbi:ankyrin repeat domain-containing protein [Tuwongella immobilis]|uniref:Uncharacterized protein n=1 Tax=Tuwongella immobilis TaxID=692036 RepID=A0A6C2YHY9_9BACT|nr:ankyrin repeat domain-containing protein [Tuwongella immobilis]VIP00753.1 ankyrin repeat protein partial : Putative uncharacterized protein OS=Trichomonas vaginalis GN=TVAG_006050 PE=4 SV=1: Ank_2 [Tuwongella immobilis]VTR96924.1 ankyrin repeat protein partial : Putative uncharacterized protein OS=Trichomonas vaginalis GN=TVAG_006050 PE=4 SV=1: Ank_2 [Tuwongella immobilis]
MRDWSDEHQDYVEVIDDSNVLLALAERGQTELIQEYLQQGSDVNMTGDFDETPAYLAAKANNLRMLKILTAAGADLDRSCVLGFNPLHWAKTNNNPEMIEFITQWYASKSGPSSSTE